MGIGASRLEFVGDMKIERQRERQRGRETERERETERVIHCEE